MNTLTDTSPEAQRVLDDCYRRMSPARKWAILDDAYRFARALHASGVRLRQPGATDVDVRRDWVRLHLGDGPWLTTEENVDMFPQPIEHRRVFFEVLAAFDRAGITCAVGGFDEFEELSPWRAFSSRFSASSFSMRSSNCANSRIASGGVQSTTSELNGSRASMPQFFQIAKPAKPSFDRVQAGHRAAVGCYRDRLLSPYFPEDPRLSARHLRQNAGNSSVVDEKKEKSKKKSRKLFDKRSSVLIG